MNTLDVTQFGVQKLDAKEMVEVEGGNVVVRMAIAIGKAIAKQLYDDPTALTSSGWDNTPYGHYGGARP